MSQEVLERLSKEKDELFDKVNKLEFFLSNYRRLDYGISDEEHSLLFFQLDAMSLYLNILRRRIMLLNEKIYKDA